MNKKGFTLTELLVVVVILGIIVGISIPLIRNLSTGFEKKKYQNYADTVLVSAKAYTDSYYEDLFGHNEYGCAYIPYSKLVERRLLKDIEIDGVTCNSNKTYVRVIKQKDKFAYKSFLTCGKKEEDGTLGKVFVTNPTVIPEMDTTSCTGVSSGNLSVTADMSQANGTADKLKKKTRVKISSGTGIDSTIVLYAKWSQTEDDHADSGFEKLGFKVRDNQQERLLNGDIITTQTEEILTPDGNGDYYLIVRVDQLQDLYGNKWKNPDNTDSKYLSFGPFTVDSVPPSLKVDVYKCDSTLDKTGEVKATKEVASGSTGEIFNLSNIDGNVDGWATSAVYSNGVCLAFEATDNLSIKSATWEWNVTGQKANASGYKTLDASRVSTETFDNGTTNKTIIKSLSGDGHRYARLTVKDYAGHKVSVDIDLKLDKTGPLTPVINNPSGGNWTNKNIKLTISSNDVLNSINEYYYTYNSNATSIGTNLEAEWVKMSNGTGQTSFTTETWTDNIDKDLYIRATDSLGNLSAISNTKIRIDKTAPGTPTIQNPTNGTWVNYNYKLDIDGVDTAAGISTCSGIGEYYYTYNSNATDNGDDDETQWKKLDGGTGQTSFKTEKTWSATLNNDFNKVTYIKVCDKAGNCSNASSTDIKIDKTPPAVPTINNPKESVWTKAPLSITISSSDESSGLGKYYYTYNEDAEELMESDTESAENWALIASGTNKTSFSEPWSAERNQYAYIKACDKVGNCSDKNSTMIMIDNTAPSCGTVKKTVTYDRNGVDGNIGCSDTGAYQSGCSSSTFSFKDLTTSSHSVTIKDTAGNTRSCNVSVSSQSKTEKYTTTCNINGYYTKGYALYDGPTLSGSSCTWGSMCKQCKHVNTTAQTCQSSYGGKWYPYRSTSVLFTKTVKLTPKELNADISGVQYIQASISSNVSVANTCDVWQQTNGSTAQGSCWYNCTSSCSPKYVAVKYYYNYDYQCEKSRTYYVYY